MLITGIIINNQYWRSYSTSEQSAKLFVFLLIFKKIIIRIIDKLNRFSLKMCTFAKLILIFIQKHNSNLDIYDYIYIYIFFRKYSIREIVWYLKVIWFFKKWAFFNKVCILKIQVIYNSCKINLIHVYMPSIFRFLKKITIRIIKLNRQLKIL